MDYHDFCLEILNDLREYTNDVTPLDPDMAFCTAPQCKTPYAGTLTPWAKHQGRRRADSERRTTPTQDPHRQKAFTISEQVAIAVALVERVQGRVENPKCSCVKAQS